MSTKLEKEYEKCYEMSTKLHSESFPVRLYHHLKRLKKQRFLRVKTTGQVVGETV